RRLGARGQPYGQGCTVGLVRPAGRTKLNNARPLRTSSRSPVLPDAGASRGRFLSSTVQALLSRVQERLSVLSSTRKSRPRCDSGLLIATGIWCPYKNLIDRRNREATP